MKVQIIKTMIGQTLNRMKKPVLISVIMGIILFLLFGTFLLSEARLIKERQINRITRDYVHFQEYIHSFVTENINLMKGFSAYIQTVDQYDDEEVYAYLENLTKNNQDMINNVGIIQDTTIKWVFPLQGNEKVIGTDLSRIPDQAASIDYVKKNLTYHLDGPRQLVQGGTGYIIRMPLIKNDQYWGMVSLVLHAGKVQELITGYEKDCNLRVAILDRKDNDKLILGDPSVLQSDCQTFNSTFYGNHWTVCVAPIRDYNSRNWSFLLVTALIGIVAILIITRFIYRFFREAESVKEKNNILNETAYRDRLTGIYNRGFFDIRIKEEISAANRHVAPLSVIFFDLDHFKRVNDIYGHAQGDAVLRETSQTVNSCLRTSDIIARWGGEEFAVLLPHTNLAGAMAVAEKMRMVIEAIDHPIVGTVTASFGVAEYFPEEYKGSLFKRLDGALYRSKQEGRNRVSVSEFFSEGAVQYRIQWLEAWNSGNQTIDMDHRILLELGNMLVEDSYKMNSLEESVSRYNELLNHIDIHFQREETILKELNYPMLEAHRDIHHELLEKAAAFREELREHTIDPQWLFEFLISEIIIGHLEKEDTKFFGLFKHA